eukprot:TRINITY_DN77062_c0_g1_i1.p1 TRINITY_DN77062_c0_g1~~TRINITY_DN77062_c0_g1_i1.p1  ORF type:complete len:464 (-),score=7.07 TRINITY_DN77062_c0_g1_i1:93-1484(-)
MFISFFISSLFFILIHGEENKNPPSMFATDTTANKTVNFEDWLSLPEVFSKLDFNADSTPAADDDIPGQMKLRSSRYWGRLYIEGFPQPIQYFRAHFGDEPPIGRKYFIFSESRDACQAITLPSLIDADNNPISPKDIVVIAHRGTCSFGVKATNVFNSGANGFIMVNNEPGLEHHPSPDTHDIELSVTSIAQPEGQLLEMMYDAAATPSYTPLSGYLIPINCGNTGICGAATVEERNYINNLSYGGYIKLNKDTKDTHTMEYLLAHFGTKVLNYTKSNNEYNMVMAKPAEACDELINSNGNNDMYKGKVVLVRRGGCPFVKKAEIVQAAGGIFMLVGSKHPYLVRMGVEPRWKGLSIAIPIAMVSKHTYSALFAETISSPTSTISFNEANVSDSQWDALEQLYNGQGWPRTINYAEKKYEELKAEHKDWSDRLNTVEEAFKRFKDSKAAEKDNSKDTVKSEL